jgi:hypothetical protein
MPYFIISISFPTAQLKAILGFSAKGGESGATGDPRLNVSTASSPPRGKIPSKTLAIAAASAERSS